MLNSDSVSTNILTLFYCPNRTSHLKDYLVDMGENITNLQVQQVSPVEKFYNERIKWPVLLIII